MRQINLSVAAMPISPIPLFYQGEMNATVVCVDIGSWVDKFGDGEGQIHYQRPGDSTPYVVNATRSGDVLEWTVAAADVIKPGTGQMQVVYTSGDTVVRSAIVPTRCAMSLGQELEPPTAERPWYEQAVDAAERAEAAADRAEDASTLVWVPEVSESGDLSWTRGDTETPPEPVNIMGPAGPRGETGPRGPQGETGSQGLRGETGPQGQVGATPNLSIGTVSTLAAGSSATATITGTAENPVLNLGVPAGADGQDGADGADGAPGAPGADGGYYTPYVTQPTDSTMQVAFSPSQADMAAVEPVTVALPVSDEPTGISPEATALLIEILRNAVYTTDQSANITALESALAAGSSGDSSGDDSGGTESINLLDGTYVVGLLDNSGGFSVPNTHATTTDYIDCAGLQNVYSLIVYAGDVKSYYRVVAFYDADKAFIQLGQTTNGATTGITPTTTFEPISVPENAAYVRVSYADLYCRAHDLKYLGTSNSPDTSEFTTFATLIE